MCIHKPQGALLIVSLTDHPLIIAVAPNGGRRTKSDHPALPLTAAEIAKTASECCAAGASMLHMHVRDIHGSHTLDPQKYDAAIKAIRDNVGDKLVIQITTESLGKYLPDEQMEVVRTLIPEAASIAIREVIPEGHESSAGNFLEFCAVKGILVQYILYSLEDIKKFLNLVRTQVIPEPRPSVLFVLGRYDGEPSYPSDMLPMLAEIKQMDNLNWSICAFGAAEGICGTIAAGLGGHIRVGFENNLFLCDGTIAPNNAALVEQAIRMSAFVGRKLANANDARLIMRNN